MRCQPDLSISPLARPSLGGGAASTLEDDGDGASTRADGVLGSAVGLRAPQRVSAALSALALGV